MYPLAQVSAQGNSSLEPNLSSDVYISCKIEYALLAENPKYKALSYTWGVPTMDVPILIEPKLKDDPLAETISLFTTLSLYAAI